VLSLGAALVATAIASVAWSRLRFVEDTQFSERLERVAAEGMELVQLSNEVLLYHSPRTKEQWREQHWEVAGLVADNLKESDSDGRLVLDRIDILLRGLPEIEARLADLRARGASAEATAVLASQFFRDAIQLQASFRALKALADQHLRTAYRTSGDRLTWIFAIFALLTLAYGIFASLLFRKTVLMPLRELDHTIKSIAQGSAAKARVFADNEIGAVSTAFNSLIEAQEAARIEIRAMADRFRNVFDQAAIGMGIISVHDGQVLDVNKRMCEIVGATRHVLIKSGFRSRMPPEDWKEAVARYRGIAQGDKYIDAWENHVLRENGRRVAVRTTATLARGADGAPLYLVTAVEDISARKAAESRVSLLAAVFENSSDAILITDQNRRVLEVNPAFTILTGYAAPEVQGRDPGFLASSRHASQDDQAIWEAVREKGGWSGEIWGRSRDGQENPRLVSVTAIRDDGGAIAHFVMSLTDITARKAYEERIRFLAHHDPLTGLPNRLSLRERLEQTIALCRRKNGQIALLFIDLDNFKTINDSLGHQIGDALLCEVAQRLKDRLRESDVIARLGGDEFVVVLSDINPVSAPLVANKLLRALGETYRVGQRALHSTASIGISMFPGDGKDVDELMRSADSAMYGAKAAGRNTVQFFTQAMNEAASQRLHIEDDLRAALREGQFFLHFQPQLDLRSGRVSGVEALLRWRHPTRGVVAPGHFIPIAEESGLIVPIGAWVIVEAARQLAAFRVAGLHDLQMSVNLSARQIRDSGLAPLIENTIARFGLAPGDLELEVTESLAMENPERTASVLKHLHDLGIGLSVDDFGTGYSSLAHLKQLPLDALKIDRSFVRDIERDENDAAICSATISLAHGLGLMVVAEGVETDAQLKHLAALGCDLAQGFFICKPVTPEACAEFIAKTNRVPLQLA